CSAFSCLSLAVVLTSFYLFFFCYADHRDLHSFPTRRSSDLFWGDEVEKIARINPLTGEVLAEERDTLTVYPAKHFVTPKDQLDRSEEHTSELQSRENLVCRLLLEKKKNNSKQDYQRLEPLER